MSAWVDFQKLRCQLAFETVLQHYRVSIKRRGSQGTARCPLPAHPRDSTSVSFSVSFQKGIFQCFGCGAKGNVLDFVAYMEQLDPRNAQEFRRAALIAQERFVGNNPPTKAPGVSAKPPGAIRKAPVAPSVPQPHSPEQQVLVNEPLDFELNNLDTSPAYLLQRGFNEETITHFGLGLCTKGTFSGRIVIPLHDLQGRLIGYAGRLIFDDAIDAENPKYLYPPRRLREGRVLEFSKSLFVYHGHAVQPPLHDLVVVQGFPTAWWLWQHGYRDVVALMGGTCSTDQGGAILQLTVRSARIWCFTDAGKASEKCAYSLFSEVGPYRFCKWIRPENGQPTTCDAGQLAEILERKVEN